MPAQPGPVIFLRHFIIEDAPISHSSPNSASSDATTFTQPRVGDIIIDIRHPAEVEAKPLETGANRCIELPFYSLEQQLDQLDPDICYLLYCDKGIMSRLQAALMREKGFSKVGMFSIKS
ncbi:hypothetical protein N2382_01645 [SAR92 clade bacterium H921]|jgi:thiamine biosynthesis protein ThiI|nr:hypothetical protein [SAR92 clade bacterium H921]MDG0971098.1 hypothetical protein [Porticoccaceae bacterium]MDG1306533.1 hypothetical protein [Porticoccaceae bacterium]